MKNVILVLMTIVLFTGCKENANMLEYDQGQSYIYFAEPNSETNSVEKYTDSIFYSFATDEAIGILQKVIKIPINIAGNTSPQDRRFKYVIAPTSDYDPALVGISEPVIRAGKFVDTLYVTIKRGQELSTKEMSLTLELQDSDDFLIGNYNNRQIKIAFTDVLTRPSWWIRWAGYFGPFHKEVLQKWMQIYYLGVDPTPELYNNIPPPYYYWNQMPVFPSTTSYPITHMYLEKLKKYFDDNIVYPNGDATKDRILLP